jgi:hypothetical protein
VWAGSRARGALLARGVARGVAGAAEMEAQKEKESQVMGRERGWLSLGNRDFDTRAARADLLCIPRLLFLSPTLRPSPSARPPLSAKTL